jgi:GT2 family glycosyltransferase
LERSHFFANGAHCSLDPETALSNAASDRSMIKNPPLPPFVVAIPARDEEERIAACLDALDTQEGAHFSDIVLLVNNSTDNTARIARSMSLHSATTLHVIECVLPPEQANAGIARGRAMQAAATLAGPGGVLFTTDADGLVDPDWLQTNTAALRAGVDVVAGWCELHPLEWGAIPAQLHEDDARECAYDALCDEIHGRLDPDPSDPLPRHTQHSGASIAVTSAAFAKCGGVPRVASGEDRALIAALRRTDARIRHAPEVHVTVSGRTQGRAVGGMADTIRRRLYTPDEFLDDRLEPALQCARRAKARAALHAIYSHTQLDFTQVINLTGISEAYLRACVEFPCFGMAWEAVERQAPLLIRQKVAVCDLPDQVTAAHAILNSLRSNQRSVISEDLMGEEL